MPDSPSRTAARAVCSGTRHGRPGVKVTRATRLLPYDQARGGWNGGAEEIPKSGAAARIGDSEWSAMTDSRRSGRLTTASGLGAQTEPSAQFGAGDSHWARVLLGIAPSSGIWHSGRLARCEIPKHAAVPNRGCSWSSRSRIAQVDFIGLNLIGNDPQEQDGSLNVTRAPSVCGAGPDMKVLSRRLHAQFRTGLPGYACRRT